MHLLRIGFLSLLVAVASCGDDSSPTDGSVDNDTRADSGGDTPFVDTGAGDTGTDAITADTGAQDTGAQDTGAQDTGAQDTGAQDASGDTGPEVCTISEDCGGEACFLFPDGTRDCIADPGDPPRNVCDGGLECGCTDDSDCADGAGESGVACVAFEYRYCGGAAPPRTNVCRRDECTEDADCDARMGGGCIPRGLGNFVATCAYGPCRTSADCREGGTCDIYDSGCGTGGGSFFCSYPDDVCSDTVPCDGPGPMLCVPNEDGQGTQCIPNRPRP